MLTASTDVIEQGGSPTNNGPVPGSHLASDQHSFFLLAVHQPSDGSGLRVEVLHLCPVSEVVDGDLSPGIPENELALPIAR